MSTPVEQIKERLGIADVVGSYLKLERAGSSLKAKCPFHNEKTPSFFVSPARGSYYCFGCQAHGDIFTFVQEFEGLDFIGALRVLAGRAGVTLTKVDPKVQSEYARLYLCLEKATRFFEETLRNNEEARQYLLGRGLTEETIKEWRLGFAEQDWRRLFEHLLKEGFKTEEMEKVGLIKQSAGDKGRQYDIFRGRIMFPIRDSAGRVIAFSGRILPALDDGKTGKYINSPETVLFKKSEVFYGFDKAKLPIRIKDSAILVEGQMDLLMAHQAGYDNTIASSGTALTDSLAKGLKGRKEAMNNFGVLKRLSDNLFIAFDRDSAGLKAAERAIRVALGLGFNVKAIALKEKDPAELILKEPSEWERAVKGAKHIVDFLLENLLHSAKEGRERALSIERTILPLLRLLQSSVEQSHFLKVIAEKSGLREEALWEAFKKIPVPDKEGMPEKRKDATFAYTTTTKRRVFGIYFFAESRNDKELLGRIHDSLLCIFGERILLEELRRHKELRDPLLLEVETLYGDGVPSEKEEQELVSLLGEGHVTGLLSEAMDKLAAAERAGSKEEAGQLLQTCKELTQKLAAFKAARFQS
ncbi:MAG: DNA primase [Candidatus Taylorbacteria bacterium RIFCSPHIGHO2_02_49_25]|uniref:DNA primase n=1 Tax=Candidatus Taylorbacteria bacterium RIFCSPHIGHO2_02_49_25 TaxID=1802305 RepID=A0A1G2MK88_9BACT|nr:MAG: primase protein [Parcubacteria group bacterium GW2011_GWF2_50_9]OHA20032.1 MAG: DNA primase [Candidatus Taylorbacteria bacterium RIFCSPHIGHO2_01_FULL_49_60]OHA23431.1 MAG: DNA primase [Candidatus Taylorbacteria bacterium RIFCSPHIGHO2_02_49_25]OHA36784.1 MAG: DNA primase [Candidatus Taylorbacteria bacterium RIFCSPLOWO2_02_50_13]OHA48035.1 MAG: DNA primase [Candidatus Taylorbacteria bacterium RIFCSPLOWO2_12_FULL_49_67]